MGYFVTSMGEYVTLVGCQIESKKELKKHAAAIHCSNTLSLLQRKITNALLYHAYKELLIKDEHEITVKQLCRLIGYQGNNHAVIKEALKGLISTVIEWNLINDETGQENWTASSILASVSLEGPLCYYAYSPRMKQLLHTPSMFGKIDLVIQSRFRSSYGLALYENCIRYRGLPHTKWFEIELFKKLMGIPQGKYPIFRDFKRRVLDKAIQEVNTYSDLITTPEYIKEGRKVVRVRFVLKDRAKKTRLGGKTPVKLKITRAQKKKSMETNIELLATDNLAYRLETEFNLSIEQIDALRAQHTDDFLKEKMMGILGSNVYQSGKIQNLAAYLQSAIKKNYLMPQINEVQTSKENLASYEFELNELKRAVEDIRLAYSKYREETIHVAIESLTKEDKTAFMQAFFQEEESAIRMILHLQRKTYSRENILTSPQIKALLRQFAVRELDLNQLIPLEEFVATLSEPQRAAWQKFKSYDPDHLLFQQDHSQ